MTIILSRSLTWSYKQFCCHRNINLRYVFPSRRVVLRNGDFLKAQFHVTSRTPAAPLLGPLLVKLSGPLSRISFLLVGRRFRKWWQKLSPEAKERYYGRFNKSRDRLLLLLASFSGLSVSYYFYHLEETPVTGRRRFIILNKDQLEKVAEIQWRNLDGQMAETRLPVHSLEHTKVYRVAKRILDANRSMEVNALKWEINVISNDQVNAFVLANGQMYVFTGMLNSVRDENELAGILGHEMAHAILSHSAEQLSNAGFVNLFSIALLTLLWAIVPTDGLAILASWLQNSVEDILIKFPYSRKLEREADEVGLLLAARACYDVRHIPKFWERMYHLEKDTIVQRNEWLSTHPSHEKRVLWLHNWLPTALKLREDYKCPELKHFLEATHRIK